MYKAAQGIEAYVYEDKIEDADAGERRMYIRLCVRRTKMHRALRFCS
jgi:hypothetical protein